MILVILIAVLMIGGLLAWVLGQYSHTYPKWIALFAVLLDLLLGVTLWSTTGTSGWIAEVKLSWIPQWGVNFHLGMDGLSLLLVMLTFFLGILAVLTSWKEIQKDVGFYYFNLMWVLGGIIGVFLTLDLFLFYFFWEVMLIPMYFLISIWGHENRRYAAYKFFIFTQASGLLMLLSILALYFVHGSTTNTFTFDYSELLGTVLSTSAGRWIAAGFLAAFMVKLPVVPFHSWLPDAHAEAPTAGSLVLAGLLLKTGAYGLVRFVVPLFPEASAAFAPTLMLLGVIGILYGAVLAFAQTDIKRLIAYTSVSHMGFIMLGVFSFNTIAMQGVVMQMITHGISTGALFILAGMLYERIHTRDISTMGGFWRKVPFMGVMGLIFAMASLGLPGMGNFIAEFLTLIGAWGAAPMLTVWATIGLIGATAYSLRIVQKIFLGPLPREVTWPDLSPREKLVMLPLVLSIIFLGLFPRTVLHKLDGDKTVVTTAVQQKVAIKTEGGAHD